MKGGRKMDRRGSWDIYASILKSCRLPTNTTRLMCKANLGFYTFQRRMDILEREGFIRELPRKGKTRLYVRTAKAQDFIRAYGAMVATFYNIPILTVDYLLPTPLKTV